MDLPRLVALSDGPYFTAGESDLGHIRLDSWRIWWKEEEDPTRGRVPHFRFRVSSAALLLLACKPSITLSFAHTNENYL